MTKEKISSKVVRARSLAMYELEQFINYVRGVDQELKPDQAIRLAAYALSELPRLFQENPTLLNQLQMTGAKIRDRDRSPKQTN